MRTGFYDSPFGRGYFLFKDETLHRVFLPGALPGEKPISGKGSFQEGMRRKLEGAFRGEPTGIQMGSLFLNDVTPFALAVLKQTWLIPAGKTVSYGELAEAAGFSGGGRAVGNVMATNPFPIVIPCHRVIRADGTIGGYQCSIEVKGYLLSAEKAVEG